MRVQEKVLLIEIHVERTQDGRWRAVGSFNGQKVSVGVAHTPEKAASKAAEDALGSVTGRRKHEQENDCPKG